MDGALVRERSNLIIEAYGDEHGTQQAGSKLVTVANSTGDYASERQFWRLLPHAAATISGVRRQ
jgi:hypothetical protein